MKCEFCSKEFLRPHKYKTESEAFHVNGCKLKYIKKKITNKLDSYEKNMLVDDLEYISKVSSFGAEEGNKYYKRMLECQKLLKQLKD